MKYRIKKASTVKSRRYSEGWRVDRRCCTILQEKTPGSADCPHGGMKGLLENCDDEIKVRVPAW